MMLVLSLSGCGFFGGAAIDEDADLTELEGTRAKLADAEISMDALPEEHELELKLKVGDRFPLMKTVEQRLTQKDNAGVNVNTSKTEMMMSLVVDEVQADGRKKLTVRYHRVQYDQDIRGQRISYSSDRSTEPVPTEALLYAGLANNGFAFWLGVNNKIVELIDFNDFLKRCLHSVPPQHIAAVQQQLETMKTEDGIANFIDESIGLLPYSEDPLHPAVAVKEGTSWDLEPRQTEQPIPTRTTMKCTLKDLSTNSAEIVLLGRIAGPGSVVTMRGTDGDMRIFVRGGQCEGTVQVDRQTGLPTRSQMKRYLEMMIEMPDGQRIQQSKETLSTITSFLNQSQKPSAGSDGAVQQTQFQKTGSGDDRQHSSSRSERQPSSGDSDRQQSSGGSRRRQSSDDSERPRRSRNPRKF